MKKGKTIDQVNRNYCTGCSACYSICPTEAIELEPNINGFSFPKIDSTKCTNCGICYKICPLNNGKSDNNPLPKSYAMQNVDDSILQKSSSGGVFYELAKQTLEEHGVVYGCAMVDNVATHIRVDSVEKLIPLLGSKYVQSDVRCFSDVKRDLESGVKVLFSGTPCHIAGLKSFLRKDFENLLCVDFICHGVPSPKVLKEYILHCEKKYATSINEIKFRSKKFGWDKFALELSSNGKEVLCEPRNENLYLKTFLTNVSIRSSCGHCKFNTLPRYSDITLGDFWSGKLDCANAQDGLSVVTANNERGLREIEKNQEKFKICDISLDDIKKGNPFIEGHCKLSKKRRQFFKNLDNKNIEINMKTSIQPTLLELAKEISMHVFKKIWRKTKSFFGLFLSKIEKTKSRLRLKNRDFTIISNNCWGGLISQKYGLPYRSPTCGLLILGEDYIKFCADLKHYLSQKLEFISFPEGKYSYLFKDTEFPVAKLDDIEIYFMHYHSNEEAAEKWYRRAKRINWDCIIYKISERATFTPEIMQMFTELPLENKLIFASQKYTDETVIVPGLNTFSGDETPLLAEYFDELKYLNKLK